MTVEILLEILCQQGRIDKVKTNIYLYSCTREVKYSSELITDADFVAILIDEQAIYN